MDTSSQSRKNERQAGGSSAPPLDVLKCRRSRDCLSSSAERSIHLRRSRLPRFDGLDHRLKYLQSIRAAESLFTGTVRMRHQAKDISFPIADAGDVFNRTVRV